MPVTCNLKGDKEKKGRWSRGVPVKTGPEIEVRQSVKPRPPEDGRWKPEFSLRASQRNSGLLTP